jgi:hypothetical protein
MGFYPRSNFWKGGHPLLKDQTYRDKPSYI